MIWKFENSGVYTVKSGYNLMIKEAENDSTRSDLDNGSWSLVDWNALWKMKIPHKIQLFLWKLINNGLPLKATIAQRTSRISPLCSICNAFEETAEHLFLHCPLSKSVWFGSNLGLRTCSLAEICITDFVQKFILEKVNDPRHVLMICSILWNIWLVRNKLCYQGTQCSAISTLFKANSMYSLWYNCFSRTDKSALVMGRFEQSDSQRQSSNIHDIKIFYSFTRGKEGFGAVFLVVGKHDQILKMICRTIYSTDKVFVCLSVLRESLVVAARYGNKLTLVVGKKGFMRTFIKNRKCSINWRLQPISEDILRLLVPLETTWIDATESTHLSEARNWARCASNKKVFYSVP